MSLENLFLKIAAEELPSYKIYADEHVFAFLDINPLSRGHLLVVPREKYRTVDELPDETAAAIGRALPRLARAVMKATGAKAFNILSNNGADAGQVVPHVHFHIIPRIGDAGLPKGWPSKPLDEDDAPILKDAIIAALND